MKARCLAEGGAYQEFRSLSEARETPAYGFAARLLSRDESAHPRGRISSQIERRGVRQEVVKGVDVENELQIA